MELSRGVFTISLDFELIWGTLDLFGPERYRRLCEIERAEVIERLLRLFEEYKVSATWCTLGHLFLNQCSAQGGEKHPEISRPSHDWVAEDWFHHDPCEVESENSVFVGRSLVEKIRDCRVPQEVGCHSYSHVIFGDAGCSRATAASEVAECVRLAEGMGLPLRSFAFPRNQVGHLDVLREYDFTCYRGPEPHWYERRKVPDAVRRLAHLWQVLTAATPPVVLPERMDNELWNIPGSMIFFPMHGFRRYLPMSLRVRRAVKGLNLAAHRRRIFHLWFHPTNLADQMETMFAGLREILEHADKLRARGELEVLTMENLIQRVTARSGVS